MGEIIVHSDDNREVEGYFSCENEALFGGSNDGSPVVAAGHLASDTRWHVGGGVP